MKPQNGTGIVICDVDGTLADLDHRRYLIEGDDPDWDSFRYPINVAADEPKRDVIELVDTLALDSEIWLFTGRPERLRETTEEWLLEKACLSYAVLAMRPDDDNSADDRLKRYLFDQMLRGDQKRVWLVVDDRDKVVKMWRHELGLTCLQVADGDF